MTPPDSSDARRVLVLIGTRPESIKLAPVVHELTRRVQRDAIIVCAAGQHHDMLDGALAAMDVRPDYRLDAMVRDQSLAALTSRLFERIDRILLETTPGWIIVQGDTTTAMVGAMAAFYRGVRIAHVEAGLRTGDLAQPFPEELNRRVCDLCATLCFAPTAAARENLLREGVADGRIYVTGNTVVDAARTMAAIPYDRTRGTLAALPRDRAWVLVTTHRRENFGAPLERIYGAVGRIAETFADRVHVIVPVHPNPNVAPAVARAAQRPNCTVLPPLDYRDLIEVLQHAALVLTDSGGVQEEAAEFRVPLLVLRELTERGEGLEAGCARLVGSDPDRIVAAAADLLRRPRWPGPEVNPYGDGRAAERIVDALLAARDALPPAGSDADASL